MSAISDIALSDRTIAIFRADVDQPRNAFESEHYDQGFAWREGSVCFPVPPAEAYRLEVLMEDEPASLPGEPQRIIKVPFASENSEIKVGEVLGPNRIIIKIPHGRYQVVFEMTPGSGIDTDGHPYGYFFRVRFSRDDDPEFAIIKQDEMMSLTGRPVTDAKPV